MIDFFREMAEAGREFLHQLLAWVEGFAATPYGTWALFVIAFAESSFFPIPPDVLLMALCVADPERSLWFALVCSVGSVLGGAAGYGIGLWGGRPLLLRIFSQERIEAVASYFDRYNAWAVGIAGLTPIPYKVFTISGGAFAINFRVFMLASIVSRTFRFFVIGALMWWFGEPIRAFIEANLGWLSILFVVLLVGGFWFAGKGAVRGARGTASARPEPEEDAVTTEAHKRKSYRLEGRVQGVGFRAFIRREARELGIAGWARNAPDGTVEVEAAGEPASLVAFEERLRQGPPAARVERVDARDLSPGSAGGGFEIRV